MSGTMRMRVLGRRFAVSGPAGVPDSAARELGFGRAVDEALDVIELAFGLQDLNLGRVFAFEKRDPRGVVAAVFQSLQSLL
jgi:hypothetical protein